MSELADVASAEDLTIPAHIAIVMDGNGRWARQRGLPRIMGHVEGRQATKRAIMACNDLGVTALSLYTFSTENWNRPEDEVSGLMQLIEGALYEEMEEMRGNNIRFRASGRLEDLPPTMRDVFAHGVKITRDNTGLTLNLCVNYGGRAEIVDAVRKLSRAVQAGELDPGQIDETHVRDALYTAGLPDVELFLRPGGELRVSNFLLWQSAYAEFVVMDVLWPDFSADHLMDGIRAFNKRERRFGAITDEDDD